MNAPKTSMGGAYSIQTGVIINIHKVYEHSSY